MEKVEKLLYWHVCGINKFEHLLCEKFNSTKAPYVEITYEDILEILKHKNFDNVDARKFSNDKRYALCVVHNPTSGYHTDILKDDNGKIVIETTDPEKNTAVFQAFFTEFIVFEL